MRAIAIAAVLILLVVPLIGLPTILYLFPACRLLLREYQTLTGSLITLIAAAIAFFGVWFAVDGQSQNTEKQLSFQRQAEYRLRSLKRQQTAGAFVGEISMILSTLSGEHLRSRIEHALGQLRAAKGIATTMDLMLRRPGKQLDAFYRANTIEIGQFPTPLPEQLTRFYGLYAVFEDVGAQLAGNVDKDFKNATISIMEEALQNELNVLNQLQDLGPILITQLDAIRNTLVP
jgi:hypothetical protein